MQEVYQTQWKNSKNTAVALGYFDGVHIGHQFLIEQAKQYAADNNLSPAVFTFTKNVKLGHKGKDILSTAQKIEIMKDMGVELFYSPDFIEFAGFTPEEFVEDILIDSMGAKAVFCGENFFFGKNRAGNVTVLRELCAQRGVEVFIVPTVEFDGITVSSSEIRKALAEGNIPLANSMLGRPYTIDFKVVHGKKLGRKMGTPTINQIYPDSMCTPKEGVYITATVVDGKRYPSATGYGDRPTVNGTYQSCETTIADFEGDLYEKNVKVEFCSYLFPTQKFENISQLADMIEKALEQSRRYEQERTQP
ncbi:MAG: bifunctional riboflavin kinase/FAD synthetase [Ruminococcaceae bacterium]|nr:bifunctional riboflavin kinase/FAD synthetase [Oscillospiraceae bacterium]